MNSLLVFQTKQAACTRAMHHWAKDSYAAVVKDGWGEVVEILSNPKKSKRARSRK